MNAKNILPLLIFGEIFQITYFTGVLYYPIKNVKRLQRCKFPYHIFFHAVCYNMLSAFTNPLLML